MIKKIAWTLLAAAVPTIALVIVTHPDWLVIPPTPKAAALDCSDKCAAPSNPNRPNYDQWGNEFDYKGNLVKTTPREDSATHAQDAALPQMQK